MTVVVEGTQITTVGGRPPDGAPAHNATGANLLPGLFDAHVHTSEQALKLALKFG